MNGAEGYTPKYWCSTRINIKSFLSKYAEKLKKAHELPDDKRQACFKFMDAPILEQNFKYLEKVCSISRLSMDGEPGVVDVKPLKEKPRFYDAEEVYADSELETLQALEERKKTSLKPILKYRGNIWMNVENSSENNLKCGEDVVITVRVFRAFQHKKGAKYRQEPRLEHELLVLGQQYLCNLRDAIKCASDGPLMKETSQDPSQRATTMAKDLYKSGFFFINGTFYNDHRCPENIDYSEVIRQWASECDISDFGVKKMEETKFLDLFIYLGHPYLYMHQGNCEHLLVFSDLRLLCSSDILASGAYPILRATRRTRTRMCFVCGLFAARWITTKNERIFVHTGYFCDKCFHSFNYIDGKKIGNFEAYPYNQE